MNCVGLGDLAIGLGVRLLSDQQSPVLWHAQLRPACEGATATLNVEAKRATVDAPERAGLCMRPRALAASVSANAVDGEPTPVIVYAQL